METRPGIPRIALLVGLAGWIPFWLPPLLSLYDLGAERSLDAEQAMFTVYAAIILGFLGGVRWGRALAHEGPVPSSIWIVSVAPSVFGLAAAAVHWWGEPVLAYTMILAGLLSLFAWDRRAVDQGHLPQWYGDLRTILTLGAVAATAAMIAIYALAL